jgi:hypothetical protein
METDADRAVYFEVFGEAATYAPPGGGASQAVTVIIDRFRDRVPGDGEMLVRQRRVAYVRKTEFSTSPVAKGTLVVGAETHTIRAVEDWPKDPTGTIHMLTLASLG